MVPVVGDVHAPIRSNRDVGRKIKFGVDRQAAVAGKSLPACPRHGRDRPVAVNSAYAVVLGVRDVQAPVGGDSNALRPAQVGVDRRLPVTQESRLPWYAGHRRDHPVDPDPTHAATVRRVKDVNTPVRGDPDCVSGNLGLRRRPAVARKAELSRPGDGGNRAVRMHPTNAVEIGQVQTPVVRNRQTLDSKQISFSRRPIVTRKPLMSLIPTASDGRDRTVRAHPADRHGIVVPDVDAAVAANRDPPWLELSRDRRTPVTGTPPTTSPGDRPDNTLRINTPNSATRLFRDIDAPVSADCDVSRI